MKDLLKNCRLCPRNCGINRLNGERGFCGAGKNVKVARSALHYWEEPCLSGKNGSGTVFFSECTLKCVFCQNRAISSYGIGEEITPKRLVELFLDLQNQGALNINLVTPTHFVPQIIEAIDMAKVHGLKLPVVYNTSGYENPSTIKLLKGYIDIFLPDFKYYNDSLALKYSKVKDYFKFATESLAEMVAQTGKPVFDANGIMQSGTIVRHMMLPKQLFDSKKVIDYLYSTYKNDIYISIMNQYTPTGDLTEYPELQQTISPEYYNCLIDYALDSGVKNAFIQGENTASESFIPDFFNKL